MVINYFQGLFNIIIESFKFSFKNFRNLMPHIWTMILIQILGYIELMFALFSFGQGIYSFGSILRFIAALVLYFIGLFFMFKKMLSFLSNEFNGEDFSNIKTIKALLILGFFNLIPFFVFILGYFASKFFPELTFVLQRIISIFSIIFYISLSFSLVKISQQNKNMFVAVLDSIKLFFKKIHYTFPSILIVYLVAYLLKFIILVIFVYVFSYFKNLFLIQTVEFLDSILSLYSIYFFAVLYLGFQVVLLKKFEGE